jgi:hypothetical protein
VGDAAVVSGGAKVVLGARATVVLVGRLVVGVTTVVDVGGVWLLFEFPFATTAMMMPMMMSAAMTRAIHMPRPFFWGR